MAGIEVPVELSSVSAYLLNRHGSRRELSVRELDVLDAFATDIVNDIADRWPVDTSTSRDAFTFTIDGEGIGFTIENDADYAEWIHRAGEPADPPLWETLIPEVFESYRGDLVAAMKAAIDETEAELAAAKPKDRRKVLTRRAA